MRPIPLGSIYNASKFAVEGFSEALSYELESFVGRMRIVEPGLVRSDFGTRSMVFAHDPALDAYRPMVEALGQMVQTFAAEAEPPEIVAEVVWNAIDDPTTRLRFPAGEAAEATMPARARLDDDALQAATRTRFNL